MLTAQLPLTEADVAPAWAERVAEALGRHDVAVIDDVLPGPAIVALRAEALARDAAGKSHAARIGRGATRRAEIAVRGDRIAWLGAEDAVQVERPYFVALGALQRCLNRTLMLGLHELEAHYAIFPTGAGYGPHRDRFRDDDAREVSVILYLNDAWTARDGGALRIQRDHGCTQDILPIGGTLVAFPAARFLHEVLPATRTRVALTGWFRRRGALQW